MTFFKLSDSMQHLYDTYSLQPLMTQSYQIILFHSSLLVDSLKLLRFKPLTVAILVSPSLWSRHLWHPIPGPQALLWVPQNHWCFLLHHGASQPIAPSTVSCSRGSLRPTTPRPSTDTSWSSASGRGGRCWMTSSPPRRLSS